MDQIPLDAPPRPRRRVYIAPQLTEYGDIQKITQWIGGPFGEFLGGQGDGWNPWNGS